MVALSVVEMPRDGATTEWPRILVTYAGQPRHLLAWQIRLMPQDSRARNVVPEEG